MKRVVTLLLIFMTVLFSCQNRSPVGKNSSASAEKKEITLLIYGDKTDRMKQFAENELPAYLQTNGIDVSVTLQVLPWSEYAGGQTELKLASGEDFASYTDTTFISRCINKDYLTDLTEYMSKAGPHLLERIDPISFQAFTIDGHLYAIPIGNKPNSSEFYPITVRQDLLEEVGMNQIRTVKDVEKFYSESIKLHPNYFGWCDGTAADTYGLIRALSYVVSDKNMEFINELIFTDASVRNDKLYSYFESEEFKKYAKIAKSWNDMGIINKQIVSDSAIAGSKFLAGQGMFRNGNNGRIWEELLPIQNNSPGAELKNYFIGDPKGRKKVSRGSYSTAFQISKNAEFPEAYIEVIDSIYKDQASFDFYTYGKIDEDYTLLPNGRIAEKKNSQVFLPEWATAHSDFMRFPDYVSDDIIENYRSWDENAISKKDIGFSFNLDPVKDIYAQLQSVTAEYFVPIALGFLDYESTYPVALDRLKKAGIDEYMEEYQKQFSEFYHNK